MALTVARSANMKKYMIRMFVMVLILIDSISLNFYFYLQNLNGDIIVSKTIPMGVIIE
jgi:hypothetical protein